MSENLGIWPVSYTTCCRSAVEHCNIEAYVGSRLLASKYAPSGNKNLVVDMIIGSATSAGRCIEACAFWSACIAVQPLNSDWVERQTRNARVDCMRVPTKLQRSLTAFECSRFLIRSNL